jgi:hypothetical protein
VHRLIFIALVLGSHLGPVFGAIGREILLVHRIGFTVISKPRLAFAANIERTAICWCGFFGDDALVEVAFGGKIGVFTVLGRVVLKGRRFPAGVSAVLGERIF